MSAKGRFDKEKLKNVGGTSGGLGEFAVGVALAAAGFYLLANKIVVHTAFGALLGQRGGSALFIAVLVGFGVIFFNGRSVLGWLLVLGGLGWAVFEALFNLDVRIRPTSLWEMEGILLLLGGGVGMVLRSVRSHDPVLPPEREKPKD
jgi:hypothetical protein